MSKGHTLQQEHPSQEAQLQEEQEQESPMIAVGWLVFVRSEDLIVCCLCFVFETCTCVCDEEGRKEGKEGGTQEGYLYPGEGLASGVLHTKDESYDTPSPKVKRRMGWRRVW